jgi:hypothetical protein
MFPWLLALEVFQDNEGREHATALGHQAHTKAHRTVGRLGGNVLALEAHLPLARGSAARKSLAY